MTDKEILSVVHRWMNQSIQRDEDEPTQARRMIDCRNFIEQEWQKEDEKFDAMQQRMRAYRDRQDFLKNI